ncbi:MAG: ATP-binding protein, partial [Elusimicrobiota bacterium]
PQARAASRALTLKTQLESALPAISADKKRLAQVLNNLLENAIRHTPKGGAITVRVVRDAAAVRFAVQDTGEGIPASDLTRIFESFYQASGVPGGSGGGRLGLGLSISREIVQSHKGRIWVESEGKGKGATFLFTIPCNFRTGP